MRGEFVTEPFRFDGGRVVTAYVPLEPAESIVFCADGGWHLRNLSAALESGSALAAMIVGVDGMPEDDGRLGEYVFGRDASRFDAHEEFFVGEVGGWVAERFGVVVSAERTAVWGASLGAEFALAMGLRHPDVFGVVLAASPGAGFRPPDHLLDAVPRSYLVAGRQEPFFLDNATRWADALRGAGAEVVMMERDGEHGGAFWIEEFPLMVAWAFGLDPRRSRPTGA